MMKHWICLFFSTILFFGCSKKDEVKTISTTELKELLGKEKIQLLDVRTPKETSQGSIQSAIFVNYFDTDFASKAIQKLDKFPKKQSIQ